MIKKLCLICLFVLKLSAASIAQDGDFNEKFTAAALYVDEERYSLALPLWLELYATDPNNANINYNLGLCYLRSNAEKSKAIPYLEQAVTNITGKYLDVEPSFKKAPSKALYLLAQAYHNDFKFDEAIATFNKYKEAPGKHTDEENKQVDREIAWSTYAKEMVKRPVNAEITNLGDSINTKYPEYAALISADESALVFTSRREGSTGEQLTDDEQFFEDVYISVKDDEDRWTKARPIGTNINTSGHDAAIGFSADGQNLLIYKSENGGDIYISTLEGDIWSVPVQMGSDINTKYFEPSACLTADGNTLYFTSDRPGGIGGRDIYRVVKLPNGQWSLAQNLGPVINTPFDDDVPFIHPDGKTLYFSSKGHPSMGGFDIVYSTMDEEGRWTTPNNPGYPINTPEDDVTYVTSVDGRRAFYSSGKAGGQGDKDLYMITLPDVIVESVILLKGIMNFDGSPVAPADAYVSVYDTKSGDSLMTYRPNAKTGKYVMILNPGKKGRSYTFNYRAEGFIPYSETIDLTPEMSYKNINNEVRLKLVNLLTKKEGFVALKGALTDTKGNKVKGAKIIVKDNKTGELISDLKPDPNEHSFYINVPKGRNYNVTFDAPGYLFKSENINIPDDVTFIDFTKDIVLEPVAAGESIVLNNLFFDVNQATLRDESRLELEKLLGLMNQYPKMKIEVGGHTDSTGSVAANNALSLRRANAVVKYLASHGIKPGRMIAKGYGPKKPIAPNTGADRKPDVAGMQMNRRVEFKVISTGTEKSGDQGKGKEKKK